MEETLYKKCRPETLEDIRGNEALIALLQNLFKNTKKIPHAILLQGPTGCGKTTIARIIADQLQCKGADLRELDTAMFRGIEMVREIRQQCNLQPLESPCRVYIVDECHMLTKEAQNSLLKTLEDNPPHVYFILATTDAQKLIDAIPGRCSRYSVQLLKDKDMYRLLKGIARDEGESVDRGVIDQIVESNGGKVRNAINALEQCLNVEPELRLEMAKKMDEDQANVFQLYNALLSRASWKRVAALLTDLRDADIEQIRHTIMTLASKRLLKGQDDAQAALILDEFREPFYNTNRPGLVLACFRCIKFSS